VFLFQRQYRKNRPLDWGEILVERMSNARTRSSSCGGSMCLATSSQYVSLTTPTSQLKKALWRLLGLTLTAGILVGSCFANGPLTPVPVFEGEQATSPCTPPADAEGDQLTQQMNVERDLAGGQAHSYKISLSTNQFLRVIIDQRGIDVAATICAPDGRQLPTVDRPNGASGPESVSLLSDQTGIFTLQVKSLEKNAPAGRYQIQIVAQRSPEFQDATRIDAERTVSEAEDLRGRGKIVGLRSAVVKFELASTTWHKLNEPYEEALALYGLGWSLTEIGSQGMVKFPIPVHRLRWSYESRNEHQRAIESFNRSLVIMRQLGDTHGQSIARAGIGWPYLYLDQNKEALESFEAAYTLFRNAGNVRGEAIALYGMGWVNAIQGDNSHALDSFLRSLPLRQVSKDRKGEAITLAGISRIQNRMGRNQEAIANSEKALAIFLELSDVHGQASTYSILGWINYSLDRPKPASQFFEKSLGLRRETKDSTGEANSLYGIARALKQAGKPDEALARMQEVLDIVEPLRAKGESSDLRTYYFANVQEYYEFYVDLLMQLAELKPDAKYVEAAVAANERGRARELLAILAEAGDVNRGTAEALSKSLGATEIKGLLDRETLLIEFTLGAERGFVWAVSNTEVHGYELEKPAEIRARALKLYTLLSARNQRKSGEKEVERRKRLEQVERQSTEEAAELSRILLGPVASELGTKRLVIVAEDALQLVPFGALPAPSSSSSVGRRPLILDHEVVSLPSASVLGALRLQTNGRPPAPLTLAVLADPVFTSDDPRVRSTASLPQSPVATATRDLTSPALMPVSSRSGVELSEPSSQNAPRRLLGTRWEGQQIASLLPRNEHLLALDFSANRTRALSGELDAYRIIHFATHALIDDTDPVASTIVLSQVNEKGQPQNGLLTLHDINRLKLGADLVVLSACRTALGADIRGEGMRGLAGGFMHAGVPRIAVSLWPVNDRVTAEFMVRFYKAMLSGQGMSAAAALREVQTQMLKDARWQSPYFWAPFVLQGEWR
jgi:CHAT domain-containing protein